MTLAAVADLPRPILVSWFEIGTHWELPVPDARGYQWRPPGTYVQAATEDGALLTLIKIDVMDGTDAGPVIRAAMDAVTSKYQAR